MLLTVLLLILLCVALIVQIMSVRKNWRGYDGVEDGVSDGRESSTLQRRQT